MFKVNFRNTKARCQICLKLTIKTPERRHWRRFGVFVVNFEHIFTPCSSVSIVNLERVNADWDRYIISSVTVKVTCEANKDNRKLMPTSWDIIND